MIWIRFRNVAVSLLALQVFTMNVQGETLVCEVDTTEVVKKVNPGFASTVLAYLKDDPSVHDIRPALREAGVGTLRFPGGHVSDHYLWHDISAGDPMDGLKPIIVPGKSFMSNQKKWGWRINPDRTHKAEAMDFDEYMQMCTELKVKPMVVVNTLSYKLEGGPTLDQLVETAASWVRYARQKKYNVTYWQIGNEMDHQPEMIDADEYSRAYHLIVDAMKREDPTIKTGIGIIGKRHFYRAVLEANKENVDFLSAHQYLHKFPFLDYDDWAEYSGHLIPNVRGAVQIGHQYGGLPVLVTETNAWGKEELMGGRSENNWGKALCWFDLLMQQLALADVEYSYFWSSSDLWSDGGATLDDRSAYTLTLSDRSLSARGQISQLVNRYATGNLLKVDYEAEQQVVYAASSLDGKELNILLLNKARSAKQTSLQLNGQDLPSSCHLSVSHATSPEAYDFIHSSSTLSLSATGQYSLELKPLSITVLNFQLE